MTLSELLSQTLRQGASDLHLSAGLPPMLRVDGDMRRLDGPPLGQREARDLVCGVMNDQQRHTYDQRQEVDFAIDQPGLARFRVNAFHHSRGAGGVFRTIPLRVQPLEELGMGQVFKDIALQPRGLVLVTGPTGCGKSTTLAAMVDHINNSQCRHILTIEDPIEFVHESKQCLVNQREVQQHTPSFSAALRSALREDPDIILVGELRDQETIRLALEAAETGHLVLGTLHTQAAAKTVDRIIDVFPAGERGAVRSSLSESLQAVVSQTLLRREGGGRVAAHEIMRGTPAIRNLIREDKVAQMYSAIQTGGAAGMQTLDQCLQGLLERGLISPQTAREQARAPDSLR